MKQHLRFDYDVLLEFDAPVMRHAFVLRCLPPSYAGQEIQDVSLRLEPYAPWRLQRDAFGNLLQVGRLDKPHKMFHYTVSGRAVTDRTAYRQEESAGFYRYPSCCTLPSAPLLDFLRSLSLPQEERARAWQLSEAVRAHLQYTPGVTGTGTTAAEAFAKGAGVCQDYAHVYLALARQAGLTVRYCSGLTVGEGASHAWCEVRLDGIWRGIDPTRGLWTDESYLRFNVGRDFADCPMERGIFTGAAGQRQHIQMRVRPVM